MKIFYTSLCVLSGLIGISANAEGLRHNNIRKQAYQQQIQQLPSLIPVIPAPLTVPPAYTAPMAEMPALIAKPKPTIEHVAQPGTAPQPSIAKQQPLASQAAPQDIQAIVAQPTQKPIANLSPKTKNLLTEVGAGIGSDKSEPQKITIAQGGFADEDKNTADSLSKNDMKEIGAVKEELPFDIEVSDKKAPAFNDYEVLKKAGKAMEVEQYEAAIALYQSVLTATPDSRDAMFGMATAYQKSGRSNRAKEIYSQLLEKHPDYQPALNNLLALAAQEAPERALAEFAAIEGRNPNFAGVYAQKAKIYRDSLNLPMAIKNLAKALELDPENQNYRYDLAITEDENQNYAAAAKHYADLIDYANKGVKIPVDKKIISERMNYIGSL